MDMHTEFDEKGCCLMRLSGDLTIYHVAETKPQLLEALGNSAEMEVHLGGVSEIDTAGLQLLMLAEREAEQTGKTLRLTDHSPAVVEIIQLYDLAGYFGDPVLIQSKSS